METKPIELTPEEKRAKRFEEWLKLPDIEFNSPEAKELYQKRKKRLADAYRVEIPDRVPVSLPVENFPAYYAGIDFKTVIYDYDELYRAWRKFLDDFEMDSFTSPGLVMQGRVYDLLDYRGYHWPGHGLSDSATGYQYNEGEYMMADEYDALIKNPSDFWMRTYMPRIFGLFEPLKQLQSLTDIWEAPSLYFMPFMAPEFKNILHRLDEIGDELTKWSEVVGRCTIEAAKSGVPSGMSGSLAKAPFDILGDTLRGTRGIMMDVIQQPDKLLEAIDVITEITIDNLISAINKNNGLMAMFVLHKGADGFLSPKQFEKFYWPSLRKLMLALINEGIIPMLFAEGSYDTRIETCNEFKKGGVAWLFDKTDMAHAKEVLGDTCCISGNLPTSLVATGTVEEVKEYCHRLIDICAPGGGYILAGGASIQKGKPENLVAIMEAAREYGMYS
jgi:uroporphyrinogen-III decarboxylase